MIYRDIDEMLHYRETHGKVSGFEEVRDTEPPHDINAYVPQVKFTVNTREYSGKPRRAPLWAKPDRNRKVTILYNRDDPSQFRIKPSSRVAGILLFVVGAIGAAWLWPEWLKKLF